MSLNSAENSHGAAAIVATRFLHLSHLMESPDWEARVPERTTATRPTDVVYHTTTTTTSSTASRRFSWNGFPLDIAAVFGNNSSENLSSSPPHPCSHLGRLEQLARFFYSEVSPAEWNELWFTPESDAVETLLELERKEQLAWVSYHDFSSESRMLHCPVSSYRGTFSIRPGKYITLVRPCMQESLLNFSQTQSSISRTSNKFQLNAAHHFAYGWLGVTSLYALHPKSENTSCWGVEGENASTRLSTCTDHRPGPGD
ncbi:hypothetical protein FB451DRAFT_1185945 [Mycena latifolia]|nr:hypothetical protein FB451DRAFT_1185945 [Mycena latifolia]